MIFCFDIDETICSKTINDYNEAKPFEEVIRSINRLYDDGHEIIMMTARGSVSKIDYTELTVQQLKKWGLKYHRLLMNIKPNADIFVDDKALNIEDYIKDPTGLKSDLEYWLKTDSELGLNGEYFIRITRNKSDGDEVVIEYTPGMTTWDVSINR